MSLAWLDCRIESKKLAGIRVQNALSWAPALAGPPCGYPFLMLPSHLGHNGISRQTTVPHIYPLGCAVKRYYYSKGFFSVSTWRQDRVCSLCVTLRPVFHCRLSLWAPVNQAAIQYSDPCVVSTLILDLTTWLALANGILVACSKPRLDKYLHIRTVPLPLRTQPLCGEMPSLDLCKATRRRTEGLANSSNWAPRRQPLSKPYWEWIFQSQLSHPSWYPMEQRWAVPTSPAEIPEE